MKTGAKVTAGFFVAAIMVLTADAASSLTLLQENLIDIPNRFTVVVADFEPDGLLTPESVKSKTEQQLSNSGFELVSPDSKPPISFVNVSVVKEYGEDETEYDYKLDINVYNIGTIKTKYELRKGTVWMIGSYRVTPGKTFPADVELQLSRMLRYLVGDYYAANPNVNAGTR